MYIQLGRKSAPKKTLTVHSNPNWKQDLKKNYKEIIIDNCTKPTRDAVEENEIIKVHLRKISRWALNGNFQDQRRKRAIRNEIINTVIDNLLEVYGGVGCPSKNIVRFFSF